MVIQPSKMGVESCYGTMGWGMNNHQIEGFNHNQPNMKVYKVYTWYNSHLGVVTPDFFGCFPPNSNICSQTSSDLKAPSDPLSDKWFVVVSCLCFVHWSIGWLDDLCDIFFFLCACLWHSWTMPIIDSIARLKPMFSGWEPPPGLGMRCLAVIRSSCGRNARVEHLESYVVAICYSIRCHHMSS